MCDNKKCINCEYSKDINKNFEMGWIGICPFKNHWIKVYEYSCDNFKLRT
jgi:hypothetical protein